FCLAVYTALGYTSEEVTSIIQSDYNTIATLPCHALSYSKHYTSINWYKIHPNQEGIIRKSTKENKTELYQNYVNRTDVALTEDGSLVLSNVNFTQAGTYRCYLAGKVGHRSNDSFVTLNISERHTETTLPLNVTTTYLNFTWKNPSQLQLVLPVDVSPLSVMIGFFSLSLSKVLLCFMYVG
ncbi:leucine-rich repeat-containing protein 24-like, partial [Clarias magur]